MIVYRELSSLAKDLGFSVRALYSASYHRERHYHSVAVPKGDGTFRELSVPDDFLKAIQRSIVINLLNYEKVSPYATAYCLGKSTVSNAALHTGKPVLLKLDIRHFFDHIIYPIVKDRVFPSERFSESNRILLTMLCIYRDSLPQGAPTSPAISNIVMREFDDAVGQWCHKRKITYTRYCDDMTFSGSFEPSIVIKFVETELNKIGLFLNRKKTVIAQAGQKQMVTGVVVNEKLNAPSQYRRKLRQELYYCRRYGVREHMNRVGIEMPIECYLEQLLGRINYVLQISPNNLEMAEYQQWIKEQKKHLSKKSQRN